MGVVSGVLLLGGAIVVACLPSLGTSLCGNGHIDPNETCDPGANPQVDPGCSSSCEIVCLPPDGGGAFLDLDVSNHCYFTSKATAPYDIGAYTCGLVHAHPVTFVDGREVTSVVNNLEAWLSTGRFWVGMQRSSGSGPYSALNVYAPEPGWDVPKNCQGCFMYPDGGLAPVDGGAEAGTDECVAGEVGVAVGHPSMVVTGRNAEAQVVCEREPVGSRSVPCYGSSFCFDVLATSGASARTSKGYLFNPLPASVLDAEKFCRNLTDGGSSSLVVFESRAEREQVLYELHQVLELPGGANTFPTPGFWIGLHIASADAGGGAAGCLGPRGRPLPLWVWDDGVPASCSSTGRRPSVWGDGQPGESTGDAYVNLTGGYDTGLAYAQGEDMGQETLPYVCQY